MQPNNWLHSKKKGKRLVLANRIRSLLNTEMMSGQHKAAAAAHSGAAHNYSGLMAVGGAHTAGQDADSVLLTPPC